VSGIFCAGVITTPLTLRHEPLPIQSQALRHGHRQVLWLKYPAQFPNSSSKGDTRPYPNHLGQKTRLLQWRLIFLKVNLPPHRTLQTAAQTKTQINNQRLKTKAHLESSNG
jgi:hypothetical protein